ncbi:ICE-like protease (caspase) p20 domain protein [Rhizoctonia solani]|uniref:ICE-like protease (Caspase) p20 domain protein n=1 Tax=Rhizoctonia solani TaxID=456999 RepID=A0A8H8P6X1_9AGAM|nr:ICE-like protease (caspase) p20 domain protein [Rhizoctonia solani]QRW24908.1 ICE-like protease (caspase) p20 domain protein [Rhizoctonia solani]
MTLTVTQSASRGAQDLPVATPSSPDRREIVAFIKHAISDGDLLPNTSDIKPARRRALIIAPQYREPGQTFGALPSTAADVKLVYELLVRSGYDRRNIRILCDVWSFNGRAHPTRENILHSLDWLVAGATKGDFRFLHFSGHGTQLTTDSSKGKESRILNSNSWLKMPGGWDTELSPSTMRGERITEQIITEAELVYYNEAIVTRISEEMDADLDPEGNEDSDSIGRIWDRELNEYISKLPEGCTITCIMDVSETSAAHKILFIGHLDSVAPAEEFSTSVESSKEADSGESLLKQQPKDHRYTFHRCLPSIPLQKTHLAPLSEPFVAHNSQHFSHRVNGGERPPSNVCMERLPPASIVMGLERLSKRTLDPDFYRDLSSVGKLVAEPSNFPNPVPQFVQLWTSFQEENRLIETSLLDSYVEF